MRSGQVLFQEPFHDFLPVLLQAHHLLLLHQRSLLLKCTGSDEAWMACLLYLK